MRLDFDTVKRSVRLADVVRRYVALDSTDHGPCPFCETGHDRFFIHKGGERCGCRRCEYNGDVLAFVAKIENVSLPDAAMIIWGGVPPHSQEIALRGGTVNKEVEQVQEWKGSKWQLKAKRAIEYYSSLIAPDTCRAWEFLSKRGIEKQTASTFSLGYDPKRYCAKTKRERPAIAIPWMDANGVVPAIQYRFIDDEGKDARYTLQKGSQRLLFGYQCFTKNRALVVTEGELNAMSVWQSANEYVDVLSVGPAETSEPRKWLVTVLKAHSYDRVLLWFDENTSAAKCAAVIQGPKVEIVSHRDKIDANEVLQRHGADGVLHVLKLTKKDLILLARLDAQSQVEWTTVLPVRPEEDRIETLLNTLDRDKRPEHQGSIQRLRKMTVLVLKGLVAKEEFLEEAERLALLIDPRPSRLTDPLEVELLGEDLRKAVRLVFSDCHDLKIGVPA